MGVPVETGIPAWIVPLFIFAALIIWIGLARAVAEAGIPTITPAIVPAGFVISTVGVPALGVQGMIATGMTLTWGGDLLAFITAPMSNAIRLGSEATRHRRAVFSAMATALLISLVLSACFLVYLAYRDGALNLHSQYFTGFARAPSQLAAMKLNTPTGPNLVGWLWTGAGALVMAALMTARYFYVWWPFHPIGFAVSASWGAGCDLAFHLFCLAHQDQRLAVRWSYHVREDQTVLHGNYHGAVRGGRVLGDRRRLHRHAGQRHPGVLTRLRAHDHLL